MVEGIIGVAVRGRINDKGISAREVSVRIIDFIKVDRTFAKGGAIEL